MNTHSIRHAWFTPAIPKRKYDRELDSESEWPSAYRPLSGPALEPRPTKRLRHLEGGLAELTIKAKSPGEVITVNTDPEFLAPSAPSTANQIHDAPLDGEAKPYISSIYENASPYTGFGSSAASLPLRGEISEANTSDDESGIKESMEGQKMDEMRARNGVFMQGKEGVLGHNSHPLEPVPEKRKRIDDDDQRGLEKKGKIIRYETKEDRIVILDNDSSLDESSTRSPRRRRSAFSLSSTSPGSSIWPRSQTETVKDSPEFVASPIHLSQIPPFASGVPSIPREEKPIQSIIPYQPAPWTTVAPQGEETRTSGSEDGTFGTGLAPAQALPQVQDENTMDIDS